MRGRILHFEVLADVPIVVLNLLPDHICLLFGGSLALLGLHIHHPLGLLVEGWFSRLMRGFWVSPREQAKGPKEELSIEFSDRH
jgi:hypothetical protein